MLDDLIDALEGTGYPTAHFAFSSRPSGTYVLWSDSGVNASYSDNSCSDEALQIDVDAFTRDDSSTPKDTIESALRSAGCAWALDTVQYESDSGLIHYTWAVEVV